MSDARPVPDLLLERYRLGELPEPEASALRQRLEADPELRERVAALDRSDVEIRRLMPAALLAERVRSRLAAARQPVELRRPAVSHPWRWPAALLAAGALALALSLRVSPVAPPSGGPGLVDSDRVKGLRPALSLYRKTAGGSEALADGGLARAGDVIRVGYRSLGRRYGVILSIDARGGVTRHLPERGGTAARLEGGAVVLLPHAYELDDAPGWERFFFVTAETPFEVAGVEAAGRRAAAGGTSTAPESLPLPSGLEQSTFLLTKEGRP
jgi:hypothetical protein